MDDSIKIKYNIAVQIINGLIRELTASFLYFLYMAKSISL